jgi:hypothetical protein
MEKMKNKKIKATWLWAALIAGTSAISVPCYSMQGQQEEEKSTQQMATDNQDEAIESAFIKDGELQAHIITSIQIETRKLLQVLEEPMWENAIIKLSTPDKTPTKNGLCTIVLLAVQDILDQKIKIKQIESQLDLPYKIECLKYGPFDFFSNKKIDFISITDGLGRLDESFDRLFRSRDIFVSQGLETNQKYRNILDSLENVNIDRLNLHKDLESLIVACFETSEGKKNPQEIRQDNLDWAIDHLGKNLENDILQFPPSSELDDPFSDSEFQSEMSIAWLSVQRKKTYIEQLLSHLFEEKKHHKFIELFKLFEDSCDLLLSSLTNPTVSSVEQYSDFIASLSPGIKNVNNAQQNLRTHLLSYTVESSQQADD